MAIIDRREFFGTAFAAGAGLTARRRRKGNAFASAPAGREPQATHDREWTQEEAGKLWQPMTRAVQHVGVPGHEWQAGVLWDGSIVFGPLGEVRANPAMAKEDAALGLNLLNLTVGYGQPVQFRERAGCGDDPEVTRGLEDGRLPLPYIQTKDGSLVWVERVFGHLLGRKIEDGMDPRSDDVLVVQVRFVVRNRGDALSLGHLWLHFGDTSDVTFGYKAGRSDELGPALPHHFASPFGILENRWEEQPFGYLKKDVRYVIPPPAKGKIVWHDEVASPAGMKNSADNMLEWQVQLAPEEEAELWVSIPYGPVEPKTAATLTSLNLPALSNEASAFWRQLVGKPEGAISTPDSFVNDYLAAVAGQMAEQIAYRQVGNVWMYKTSPNWYEHYWPVSAAWPLPTLDLRGMSIYSRPVLQSFIDTQTDDVGRLIRTHMGAGDVVPGEGFEKRPGFMGNFGDWTANTLLLSHGLELWALAAHYRITRDREWLESGKRPPLSAIIDGCDWILTQRRRTMREEDGRKVMHWGLLPAASTHDWLSGNTICNDSTCIYGMTEAVRMMREISHPRAEAIARELNDYRACLRKRYVEARDRARRVPMPDGTEIPYVPRDIYELDWAQTDWTYTGYGPARAGAWGAFDPHDELIDQTLAFLDAGLPQGEGFYLRIRRDQFQHPTADDNFRDVSDPRAARHFFCKHYVEYETMVPVFFDLFLTARRPSPVLRMAV